MAAEKNRKFFDLRNGLKAVDFRNKDYFDRIDEKEKSLYSPYMLMRYDDHKGTTINSSQKLS